MKKKTVNAAKCRFTLVELLVSMGVLVIIMSFILQFFVGSQRVWRSMEQRNNLYADARVAMDVMTTMLQNSFYSEGGIPFRIDRKEKSFKSKEKNTSSKYRDRLYFATKSEENLPGSSSLKYVSFQLGDGETTGEADELKIAVFCDEEKDFPKYFPPYGLDEVKTLDSARSGVCNKLDSQLEKIADDKRDKDSEPYGSVLVRHVTSFEIIPYEYNNASGKLEEVTDSSGKINDYDEFPFLVELKLTMLSPADFKIWNAMDETDDGETEKEIEDSDNEKVKFRKTHAYTFSRTVFIGEQSRLNIKDE